MKRGGSNMAYTKQFGLLSPCYKAGEQPAGFHSGGAKAKPTKKGKKTTTKAKKPSTKKGKSSKQRGGSSCGASPSVAEMGVVDKPPDSLPKSDSQDAFMERYSTTIMKGGQGGNTAPAQSNLFSINLNKNISLKTNNGSLNKIKTKILPDGTISGLAMKLIKISKNNNNPSNEKYSFEIIYKIDGQTDIKHLVLSDIQFKEFLDNYLQISEQVFPRPQKKTANAKAAANTATVGVSNATVNPAAATVGVSNAAATATVNPAAVTVGVSNAASTGTTTGGRKRKNNHK